MIGLSLSFCLRDIADGKVLKEEVSKFITGTRMVDKKDQDEVFNIYMDSYWRKMDRNTMLDLFNWALTIIEQPRIKTGKSPSIAFGHWANNEDEVPQYV